MEVLSSSTSTGAVASSMSSESQAKQQIASDDSILLKNDKARQTMTIKTSSSSPSPSSNRSSKQIIKDELKQNSYSLVASKRIRPEDSGGVTQLGGGGLPTPYNYSNIPTTASLSAPYINGTYTSQIDSLNSYKWK